VLQEKLRKTREDLGVSKYFLNRILITQEIIRKIDKRHCIKLKSFCTLPEGRDNPQNERKSLPALQWIKD
jgi:hypothetical protein